MIILHFHEFYILIIRIEPGGVHLRVLGTENSIVILDSYLKVDDNTKRLAGILTAHFFKIV